MSDDLPDINVVLEYYGVRTQHKRAYATNCPFHEDRTPSLSVNTEKQVWKCQSCAQGGSAYTLVMLKEELDYRGARDLIATLGFAAGGAGGSDSGLRGSAYTSRRRVSGAQGNRPAAGGFVPSWRRER